MDIEAPQGTLIELDSRRRAPLARLGSVEHRQYLATEGDDGEILLTPAVVMTARRAAFLEQVFASVDQVRAGQVAPVDFTGFPDLDDESAGESTDGTT